MSGELDGEPGSFHRENSVDPRDSGRREGLFRRWTAVEAVLFLTGTGLCVWAAAALLHFSK